MDRYFPFHVLNELNNIITAVQAFIVVIILALAVAFAIDIIGKR